MLKTNFFKIGDIIIILIVLALTGILFAAFISDNSRVDSFTIESDNGNSTYELNHDADFYINSNGIDLHIVVNDGKVYVADSSCKDKVCVRMGSIYKNGDMIVCLPARTIIKIFSERDSTYAADEIAG